VLSDGPSFDVLFGDGAGGFLEPEKVEGPSAQCFGVLLADVDDDGDLDLVGACASAVTVFIANGDGTFDGGTTYMVNGVLYGPRDVAAGDLTGDGLIDLVAAHEGVWFIYMLAGLGGGLFAADDDPTDLPVLQFVEIGNADADCQPDVFVKCAPNGPDQIVVYPNDGGSLASSTAFLTGHTSLTDLVLADLDEDGLDDVVFPSSALGELGVMLSHP
jgi:hypothetical protein